MDYKESKLTKDVTEMLSLLITLEKSKISCPLIIQRATELLARINQNKLDVRLAPRDE